MIRIIHFSLLLLFLVRVGPAAARVLVQNGSFTLGTGESEREVPLLFPVADTAKSLVLLSYSPSGANPRHTLLAAEFVDEKTLRIGRWEAGLEVKVEWQVVEFGSGVRIQRRLVDLDPEEGSQQTVSIDSMDPARTFVLAQVTSSSTSGFGRQEGVTAELTGSRSIRLSSGSSSSEPARVSLQIVEYQGCAVKTFKYAMDIGVDSLRFPLGADSVPPSRTLLLTNHRQSGRLGPGELPLSLLGAGGRSLYHYRQGTASALNFLSQLVTFRDGTQVQSLRVEHPVSVSTLAVPLASAPDWTRMAILGAGNYQRQGAITSTLLGGGQGPRESLGYGWFSFAPEGGALRVTRSQGLSAAAAVGVQILTFPPAFTVAATPASDTLVPEGQPVRLSAAVQPPLPAGATVRTQWFRAGNPPLLLSNQASFTLPKASMADSGAVFFCRVTNFTDTVKGPDIRLRVHPVTPSLNLALAPDSVFTGQGRIRLEALPADSASIYFTLDGTAPQAVPAHLYRGEIVLDSSARLRAFALRRGLSSPVLARTFRKAQTAAPRASVSSTSFSGTLRVALSSPTPGAVLYYRLDGTPPAREEAYRYTDTLVLSADARLRAVAAAPGYLLSPVLSEDYLAVSSSKPARPVLHPGDSTFASALAVKVSSPSQGAVVRCTFGAEVPGKDSPLCPDPVLITADTVLRAVADQAGVLSETVTRTYRRQNLSAVPKPSFQPSVRTFGDTLRVRLSSSLDSVAFFYTLNGSSPDSATGRAYSPALGILLDSTARVKARGYRRGYLPGDTAEALFSWEPPLPARPQASLQDGEYETGIEVTLSCTTASARLYYSLNGQEPLLDSLSRVRGPIKIGQTTVLKALAVTGRGASLRKSPVATWNYFIRLPALPPKDTLKAGGSLALTGGMKLSAASGAPEVTVIQNKNQSVGPGFEQVSGTFEVQPLKASTAPALTLGPVPAGLSLYRLQANGQVDFVSAERDPLLTEAGAYFTGRDVQRPVLQYVDEAFTAGDSTTIRFKAVDNVRNLLLDCERSDDPRLGFSQKPVPAQGYISITLKQAPGEPKALQLRLKLSDRTLQGHFPADSSYRYPVAQALASFATPSFLHLGRSESDPWDFVGLPFNPKGPLRLRDLDSLNGRKLGIARFKDSVYAFLGPDDTLGGGQALWMASKSALSRLTFPGLRMQPAKDGAFYRVTLRKGWNPLSNPTLSTLHWPVSRRDTSAYRLSRVKGLVDWDGEVRDWSESDSLVPWQGYFVYYGGEKDTLITLQSRPKAPNLAKTQNLAQAGPAGPALPLRITLAFGDPGPARKSRLRLGAFSGAATGIGPEDEPPPPFLTKSPALHSLRDGKSLAADFSAFHPDSVLHFLVRPEGTGAAGKGQKNAAERAITVQDLVLPAGHEAWVLCPSRQVRLRLAPGLRFETGKGAVGADGRGPSPAGFGAPGEELEILAGPAPKVAADPRFRRVKEIPLRFESRLREAGSGSLLRLALPMGGWGGIRLWSLDGRSWGRWDLGPLSAGYLDLPLGDFLARKGRRPLVLEFELRTGGSDKRILHSVHKLP